MELPLPHLYRPADPAAPSPWLLVLMHGIGSNEQDLFGLAPQVPSPFHVVSLRAPNTLGPGSYAWFTFDVRPDGRRLIENAQETASRDLAVRAVETAGRQLAVPPDRTVVGGFSQGGIMALSLLLTQPQLLMAAMVMHGRLLSEVLPLVASTAELIACDEVVRPHRAQRASLPPFGRNALSGRQLWVSHGTEDGVIPLSNARDIRDRVAQWPIHISYAEFPGGHEIRAAELSAAMAWLLGLTIV